MYSGTISPSGIKVFIKIAFNSARDDDDGKKALIAVGQGKNLFAFEQRFTSV